MNPVQVMEEIRRRRESEGERSGLIVYWVTLSSDRDNFAGHLRLARGSWPLVTSILRSPGVFRDSNSVMNDVATVLQDAKSDIAGLADSIRQKDGVDVVILSRTELRLAITSSPILLPDWFPVMSGQTVTARIEDLTWSVRVPMSDNVVALNELQRILHDLDVAIVVRLQESRQADHRRVQALWDNIRRPSDDRVSGVLGSIREALQGVANPSHFRPSTTRNPTIVGRLWHVANATSPDLLPRKAKALADALCAEDFDLDHSATSLLGVLNRPTNLISDIRELWSFQLIITLRSACQLVTAAAHADEYPMFPDVLLRTTSLNIRRFLDDAIQILRAASPLKRE